MNKKYYCSQCGAEMKLSKEIQFYDSSNGKPVYRIVGKCSRSNLFRKHLERIYGG